MAPPEEIVQTEEADTQVVKKEVMKKEPTSKPKVAVKVATAPPAPKPAPAPEPVYSPQPAHPPQSIMQACNKYASDQVNSKTEEVVKDAGIGAIAGVTGGTLYV